MDFAIAFISGAITHRVIKSIMRNKAKRQPKRSKRQLENDELVTTILPVLNNKN